MYFLSYLQYHRMGYGKALLESALDRAREAERASLVLEVSTLNSSAIALYELSGFVPIGVIPEYYFDGSSAIKMEKKLLSS